MNYLILLFMFSLVGCAPSMHQASGRDPALFDKNVTVNARPIGRPSKPLDIFVKRNTVKIEPVERENDSGSLFNAEDERNYLFASGRPAEIGRYVTVKVTSNRILDAKKDAAATDDPAAEGDDKELKELLSSLPDLEPADPSDINIVKRLRMKVMHRYDNGDALLALNRSSSRDDIGNHITVQARVPYDRLAAGDGLNTNDLMEIHFTESSEGEILERESSGWEDEYTLRLSGFDEAKSKLAMDLEAKRNQLKDVRSSLENKIKAFGNERRTMSKEREELGKRREEDKAKISQLSESVEERDTTIAAQEERIRELTPDEKPADEREGDTGDE